MIEITWLGTGSAGALLNNNTCALIKLGDYNLMFDMGADSRHALWKYGKTYKDVNGVFVTHLHGDHVGGIEIFGFSTFFDPSYKLRPDLFIHQSLAGRLWSNCLSGGMESIQNHTNSLDTYFDIHKIGKNKSFEIGEATLKPIQVTHIVNDAAHEPAYGLMLTTPNKKIFFTGDTQHSPSQINSFYEEADIIFHDCETLPFCSGVHANFTELADLPEKFKEKMYLIHFQDNVIKDFFSWQEKAFAAGFKGFVKPVTTFQY